METLKIGLQMNNAAAITETLIETAPPPAKHACQINDIKPLSTSTFHVELQSVDNAILDYQAGQYLQLDLDVNNDGKLHSLFYSIANRFDPKHYHAKQHCRLQLFIQIDSERSRAILKRLYELHKSHSRLDITLPLGQAYLQTDLRLTHLLIAAGSGISKIKCLTEEILHRQCDANVAIYWSNKSIDDFYLLDDFQNWPHQNNKLNFTPILESAHDNWQGRSGYIYQLIEKDFIDLSKVKAYLCGSPQMVYGTIDKLKLRGLKEKNCYSDVFEYAPRK